MVDIGLQKAANVARELEQHTKEIPPITQITSSFQVLIFALSYK